jgi:uncharacterized protein
MEFLDTILGKFSRIQKRFRFIVLVLVLILISISFIGITKIEFQGDFSKEMPQDLDIFKLNNQIKDKFGGQDTIFILLRLRSDLESKPLYDDIRDPQIMRYVSDLEKSLLEESSFERVISVAPIIDLIEQSNPPLTKEKLIYFLEQSQASGSFFNKRNDLMIMMVTADVGSGQERIKDLTTLIENKIEAMSSPSGVEVLVTGSPSIISTVLDLLKRDAIYTLVVASIIIFGLLLLTLQSLRKSILVFMPLIISLIFTLGTMGLIGLNISVATAGLGAMILGLGVEYGVFVLSRYNEEREKGLNQDDALEKTVSGIGSAVIGSGTTTIVGFLALTLSVMPLLQNLGLSLALGIFFSIIASVLIFPSLLILEEDFNYWYVEKGLNRFKRLNKKNKVMQR